MADWGICDDLTFQQLARGADLKAAGYEVEGDDKLYHVASRQAFIWPYDDTPDEAITPARVRDIHLEQLSKLEAERGERFWTLGAQS